MPVSFKTAPHSAVPVTNTWRADTPTALLKASCGEVSETCKKPIRSSLEDATALQGAIPQGNGFVDTVIQAYNYHHALIIRPDDVWLAILVQFNFFVNGNVEALRSYFVAHEGKKELHVKDAGSGYNVDPVKMALRFTDLMDENIVDESLRSWIIPNFSTTTANDTVVASMVMMATMKAYFSFTCGVCCGIPHVTLMGEKADWEIILNKIEKLKEYGIETVAWYHMLHPVVSRFVEAFDSPESEANVAFWQRVAKPESLGSGMDILSGWITAFCCFEDKKGVWMGPRIDKTKPVGDDLGSLSGLEFWSTYGMGNPSHSRGPSLVLDGVTYGSIDAGSVPAGYALVDVKLIDDGLQISSRVIAGFAGATVSSSGDKSVSKTGEKDTLQPLVGWWLFEKKSDEELRAEKEAESARFMADMERRTEEWRLKREAAEKEKEKKPTSPIKSLFSGFLKK